MKSIRIFCIIALLFVSTNLKANNIVLSNITSVSGSGFVQIQFDLSWENSWNSAINRDAAWVFFKFKDNNGAWTHLNLTGNNITPIFGYDITVPADLTGAMISRNTTGSGTVTLVGVQLGVTNLPGLFDIKGFAIEMVRIPVETSFYLGDGFVNVEYYKDGNTTFPFYVDNNSITLGTTIPGQLNDGNGSTGALPASFPKGFNTNNLLNLFMMKHEVSQGAYRDFLNTLTYTQQVARTATAPSNPAGTAALFVSAITYRNGIEIAAPGTATTTPAVYGCDLNNNNTCNEATDGEWIACNFLSYMDLAAFLDWAALRPMTEMEFEKACRGPLTPVSNENAAGTAAIALTQWAFSNSGASDEVITTYSDPVANANITYGPTAPVSESPTRVGIHATQFATRKSAGAGYYGALDLSGNVDEFTVASSNAAGRSFTGINGNGNLNANGEADVDYWPGINGNGTSTVSNTTYGTIGVTAAAGTIRRGGGNSTVSEVRVSGRSAYAGTANNSRGGRGGRGVKSF